MQHSSEHAKRWTRTWETHFVHNCQCGVKAIPSAWGEIRFPTMDSQKENSENCSEESSAFSQNLADMK